MRAWRLPRLRKRLWRWVLAAVVAELGVAAALIWASPAAEPLALGMLSALSVGLIIALATVIDRRLCRPLVATSRGADIVAGSHPTHHLEVPAQHWLERLPEQIEQMGQALAASQTELEVAAASWSARIEARKARLETILREIRDGVMVCDPDGRIQLYNHSTRSLLDAEPALGLGRNVSEVLDAGPIRHTLSLLEAKPNDHDDHDAELVCATASGERLLRLRVARLTSADPDGAGFVMTLQDVSAQTRQALEQEQAMRTALEQLRQPLERLGLSTQKLSASPTDPISALGAAWLPTLTRNTHELLEHFQTLSAAATSMITQTWRLEDTHLGSLADSIKLRCEAQTLPRLQCKANVWVRAEPYLLTQVIETFLQRLHHELGVSAVAMTGREEGSLVYVDFNWSGDVIAPDHLGEWLDAGLNDVSGTVSLREVLHRHDTSAWSQPDLSRVGRAMLRLPLPGAPNKRKAAKAKPARPEFFDVALEENVRELGDEASTSLKQLDYVVFDCETTGLAPSQGDEIVSIGAVRIHRGQVMHGETFELLANPGRPIPELATSIHGITDEDVADAPPVEEVVRRFHAFAGDAVLVGFNIAFDMRFLKLKQRLCGVRFTQPVLDALLLSIHLHDHTGEHTMEGIAKRLGVGVGGRHTAIGDALTTAEIFMRLTDLLPGESITTLRAAIDAQEKMVEFRRQQRAF